MVYLYVLVASDSYFYDIVCTICTVCPKLRNSWLHHFLLKMALHPLIYVPNFFRIFTQNAIKSLNCMFIALQILHIAAVVINQCFMYSFNVCFDIFIKTNIESIVIYNYD